MPDPFTIEIFYPNGEPEDMRIASKRGWTGRICFISREFWLSGADGYLAELDAPGVYILVGDDNEDDVESDVKKIYIGHADSLSRRIGQHTSSPDKSFWRYVVSVTERGSFHIAHFQWMESCLADLAKKYDRCILQNKVTPQKPQLAVQDIAAIKTFAMQALQIFPIMEINALKQPRRVELPKEVKASGDGEVSSGGAFNREQVKAEWLVAFERHKGVQLLRRTHTTFYDADKQTRVYCAVARGRDRENRIVFRYTVNVERHLNFLRKANEGYFLFTMAGESCAVLLPVGVFDEVKDDLNAIGDGDRYFVVIQKIDGRFKLRLAGDAPKLDLSPHLLDVS